MTPCMRGPRQRRRLKLIPDRSRARTCVSAATRRSSGAREWSGSFPTPRVASGWSEPSVPTPTRAGSRIIAPCTWSSLKEQKKELRLAASPITASALNLPLHNLTYTTLRDPAAELCAHLRTFGFCSPWRGQDVPSPGCRPLMARPTIPQRASADARGDPASGKATCLWRNTTLSREAISRASLSVSVSWYCRGSRFTSACINLQASPSAATWTTSRQKPVQLRWKNASSC